MINQSSKWRTGSMGSLLNALFHALHALRDKWYQFYWRSKLKKSFALIAMSVILAACAAPVAKQEGQSSSIMDVKVESSNAASVTLTRIFFSNDANNQKIADFECGKYKKVAQFVAKEKDRRRYNCVAP